MELIKSMAISTSGMKVQGERIKVIAENLANAESTAKDPASSPYRRKLVTFKNELDRELGLSRVRMAKVRTDQSEFQLRYMPGHPAADPSGYVKMPNVNPLIEMTDMREAQRSYDANLAAMDAAKAMLMRTVDLLR